MAAITNKEEAISKLEKSITAYQSLSNELKGNAEIKELYKESIKKEIVSGTNWNVYQVVKKIDVNFQKEIPELLSIAAGRNPKSLKVMDQDVIIENREIVKSAFDKYFAVWHLANISDKI